MFMAFYAEDTLMPLYLGKPQGKTVLFTPHPNLVNPHPQPVPEIPAVIPPAPDEAALKVRDGLALWLRADAVPSITQSGDLLLYLPDASKSRNDIRNKYPSARPRYVATGINGKPSIRFDGVEDFLYLESLAANPTFASIYVVWARVDFGGNPNQPDGMNFQRLYSSGALGTDYEKGGAYANVFDPNDGTNVMRIPGKYWAPLVPAQLHKNISKAPLDLRHFFVGRLNTSQQQFFSGDIAEFLVFTRTLSAQEQADVELYLKNKYSLK